MRPLLLALSATAGIAALCAIAEAAPSDPDRLLAGRVAGRPQSCIPVYNAGESHITENGAIVFHRRYGSNPLYVNTPANCSQLRPNRALVGVHPTGQLCSGDFIQVVEPQTGFNFGACTLGDFVPYVRPKGTAR